MTIDGPIPKEQRSCLPTDWRTYLPMSDALSVKDYKDAAKLYAAGRSCAECQILTGVNAEVLRQLLSNLGMTRTQAEAMRLKTAEKRRHLKRLLESDRAYGTMNLANLVGVTRGTIIDWRRQWKRGVPLLEWSAS